MRHRKPARLALACALLSCLIAPAARAGRPYMPFADYRYESWFLPQSPGVYGGPAAGLFNPAAFALSDRAGADTWLSTSTATGVSNDWGFAFGRNLGFAMQSRCFLTDPQEFNVKDYQLNLAAGTRASTFGLAYRWSSGGNDVLAREKVVSLGLIHRCRSWLSFGAAGNISIESRAAQYVFDLGLRPLGRDWLTLFADWTVNDDQAFFNGGVFGAGVEVRPVRGLHLGARVREQPLTGDLDYSLLAGVTLGTVNFTGQPVFDKDGHHTGTHWLLRGTPPFRGAEPARLTAFSRPRPYVSLSLENKYLTYQRYRFFDDTRVAWLDLLPVLEKIRDDDLTAGIAVNLAGLRARPSLIWELRQMLQEIKDSGKEVIIHGDRFLMSTYYLASVADRITLDPQGMMLLPGTAMTRTYLKGTLEKLGLGFQELRYFKYKSAVESLSRDSMSEGDREQRQRIVDVIFEELRDGVLEGRDLDRARFKQVVDEKTFITATEAKELGLVDDLARWDDLGRWLHENRGTGLSRAEWLRLGREFHDEQWGQPPRIAVVYAVGACAMDSGIKGRATSAYMRRLAHDPTVAAVVLRADSPGGDPLPSDLVAAATRKLKEAGKPVIVSQGDVAASGGYWISMDGTRILTTPLTITGSIGVIAGWLYDDGLTGKLGMTSDRVQRGSHADLFGAVNMPFLGGLPYRPLDEAELARVKTVILSLYDGFVSAVATGRGLDVDRVREIAQGRVWMGGDAIERGLCDRYGSLADAIALARETAGIADWREVEVTEYPPRPWFQFPGFGPQLPSLFGLGDRVDDWLAGLYRLQDAAGATDLDAVDPVGLPGLTGAEYDYLETVAGHQGQPLLLVGPDLLPEGWDETD